jgi:hypothetical protein
VRHRDGRQALITGIAKETKGALGELAGGRSRELAVQAVQFSQRLLIGQPIAASKGLGWRPTAVTQMVLVVELADQALHLRW